jgi:hypothetical protein
MLRRFFKKEPSDLNAPRFEVLKKMQQYGPDNDEFPRLLDYLERLTRMKHEESRFRVSPDTMAIVAGNLLGILIIVAYEQKHVMVSKGLGQILRPHH